MATDEEVKAIIAETISELHAGEAQVLFKKPQTIQAWAYIVLAIGAVIGFMWTAVVYLNDIAVHANEPHHQGTMEIFEKLQEQHALHATSEDLHHREEHLELQIMKEVAPIKEDLGTIKNSQQDFKQDVRDIRQDVRDVQQSINQLSEHLRNNSL